MPPTTHRNSSATFSSTLKHPPFYYPPRYRRSHQQHLNTPLYASNSRRTPQPQLNISPQQHQPITANHPLVPPPSRPIDIPITGASRSPIPPTPPSPHLTPSSGPFPSPPDFALTSAFSSWGSSSTPSSVPIFHFEGLGVLPIIPNVSESSVVIAGADASTGAEEHTFMNENVQGISGGNRFKFCNAWEGENGSSFTDSLAPDWEERVAEIYESYSNATDSSEDLRMTAIGAKERRAARPRGWRAVVAWGLRIVLSVSCFGGGRKKAQKAVEAEVAATVLKETVDKAESETV